jgi:hypothetical protein
VQRFRLSPTGDEVHGGEIRHLSRTDHEHAAAPEVAQQALGQLGRGGRN